LERILDLMGGKAPGYAPLSALFEKPKSAWESYVFLFRINKSVFS